VLWLAWQVLAVTMADTWAATDPESALAWRGDNATALVTLATQQLSEGGDAESAETLARQALRADPLQSAALVTLGMAADSRGDADVAGRLMDLAAGMSPRNGGAQLWLFNQRIRDRDYADAIARADVMLRANPDFAEALSPALVALGAEPDARPALVKALAAEPPWRGWYLGALARGSASPAVTYDLLAALPDITSAELQPYLTQLIRAGDYSLALLAWMHFLPPAQAASVPYAFNGGFELPVTGLPFDWVFTRIAGASMDIVDTAEQGSGHALRVVFANRRLRFGNVTKLLVLPPGRYDLSARMKTAGLTSAAGLDWSIACADGSKQKLAATAPVTDTGGNWQDVGATFEVPPSGCPAQWLRLESGREEAFSGELFADDIAIRRAADTAAN
jgi:hypothetical protein